MRGFCTKDCINLSRGVTGKMDIKNRHAKMKDLEKVIQFAVQESCMTASAMMTILAEMLVERGIASADEINVRLAADKIEEKKAELEQYLAGSEGRYER
jgi:ribose 1,5-bisphosphokinase PhnN